MPENSSQPPKLLEQIRNRVRFKHYSLATERQYVHWVKRFILFHNKRHPHEMGSAEVEAFLSHLAVDGHVSASTQNQALSALLFLYREVLEQDLPWLQNVVRAKRPARLPVVLTKTEVAEVLERMQGVHGLMARLLYGTGMRLMEVVRLRVKDVNFERLEIVVREGHGGGFFARCARPQIPECRQKLGVAIHFPFWQLFGRPAQRCGTPPSYGRKAFTALDEESGAGRQHCQTRHTSHAAPQFCHPFAAKRCRHSYHSRIAGPRRRGHHHDLYTHVLNQGGKGVASPLDALP
jgi:integrase